MFWRKRKQDDFNAEVEAHIALEADRLREQGLSDKEARTAARRAFGNVTQARERFYESGRWRWWDELRQDLRYGLRQLRCNPGFTAVAVLTLALGIGANTAIFSLVDQILLWSIPAHEPSQLVKIDGFYSGTYPFFRAYRDLNKIFSGVLASSGNLASSIRLKGAPGVEVGRVEYVSGGYFHVLGVGSVTGRVITPSDDGAPGKSPVAVLSYNYWERRFSGNPRVIGQKLAVNGYPLEIVGVAEKGFGGLFNGKTPDAFVPLTMYPVTTPTASKSWNSVFTPWLSVVARLKPEISIQQAQAGMQVLLWSQAVERVGNAAVKVVTKTHRLPKNEHRLVPAARAPSFILNHGFLDPLRALAIATVLVLLMACANVANLLLARASQRWKETAVRLALGATRWRLVRQFLTESLLLATGGGTVGLGFAYFAVRALAKTAILDPDFRFHLSLFVLVSCVGVTLLTILLFGLVPAFRATRMRLAECMKESGPATQTTSRSRISKALVALQVALSLMLLVAASLFIRTLWNLQNIDVGFQRKNIAIFDTNPTDLGYRGEQLRAFYDQLLEHARAVPGVRAAALSENVPLSNYVRMLSFSTSSSQAKVLALLNPVSSGYFTTLGIPLLFGRNFRPSDEPLVAPPEGTLGLLGRPGGMRYVDVSRVCIIDESLARHLFGTANVVGRFVCYSGSECSTGHVPQIVGVVKDARYGSIMAADMAGTLYEPSWSNGPAARYLEVRFAGSAAPVIAGIRRVLQRQDPNVPLLRVSTMEEYVDSCLARQRLTAYLSTFFGILALALAAIGLYGVLAYAVTQRRREIGIRIALGAQRGDVAGLILRESILPVLVGVVIGLMGAFISSFLIGSLLYGVSSWNLESTLFAVAVMLAVALLACYIPARRAAKVDPMVALRYE